MLQAGFSELLLMPPLTLRHAELILSAAADAISFRDTPPLRATPLIMHTHYDAIHDYADEIFATLFAILCRFSACRFH